MSEKLKTFYNRYPLMGPSHTQGDLEWYSAAKRDVKLILTATGATSLSELRSWYAIDEKNPLAIKNLTAKREEIKQTTVTKYAKQLGLSEEKTDSLMYQAVKIAIGQYDDNRELFGHEAEKYNLAGEVRMATDIESLVAIMCLQKSNGEYVYDWRTRKDAVGQLYRIQDAMCVIGNGIKERQKKFENLLLEMTLYFWDSGTNYTSYYAKTRHRTGDYAVINDEVHPQVEIFREPILKTEPLERITPLEMRHTLTEDGRTVFAMQFEGNKDLRRIGDKAIRKDEHPLSAAEDLTRLTWVVFDLDDAEKLQNKFTAFIENRGGSVYYPSKRLKDRRTNNKGHLNTGSSNDIRDYKFNAVISGIEEYAGLDIEVRIIDVTGYVEEKTRRGMSHQADLALDRMITPQEGYAHSPLEMMFPSMSKQTIRRLVEKERDRRYRIIYNGDYNLVMQGS